LTIKAKSAVAGLACIAILAGTSSAAFAQTGGSGPGGTEPPATSPTPAPTAGAWTVYKKATWYGPGFWGEQTACGMILQPSVLGVAHKQLPCGTQVTFTYGGRSVAATVIDRGPYRKGYAWDLTKKTAKAVGFIEVGSGPIQATVTPPASYTR
jgi:rare lipoprotein A (peptidoglycan hydrolase)